MTLERRKPLKRSATSSTDDGKVELTCKVCGGRFWRYKSQVRWRGARWCSRTCANAGRKPKQRKCARCGAPFVPANPGTAGTGKFCSRTCWREDHHEKNTRKVDLVCVTCGVTFQRVAAWVRKNSGNVYCSRACQGQGRVRVESERSRGPGWRKLAESIRIRDGRRCVRCGDPEVDGRRHAVDHIVPWVLMKSRPDLANAPENLATLCHACHGIKTTVVEPRLLRGDWLALQEFYGAEVAALAAAALGLVDRGHA